MTSSISLERLEQIENERAQTFSNPMFIKWMKKLKVGRLAVNPNDMDQTRQMMSDYDYSKFKNK